MPRRLQLAGVLIDVKREYVAARLIRRYEEFTRRIDVKIAWRPAARRGASNDGDD